MFCMLTHSSVPERRNAFSFVEAIFTIAIIGIMASLAISAISNGARDANRIVARQQQAAVQEALNAWVLSQSRVSGANQVQTAQVMSVETLRSTYNSLQTTSARFNKLKPNAQSADPAQRIGFLDTATFDEFARYTSGTDRLRTAALAGARQYLTLPDWEADSEPRVVLMDE